MSKCRISSHLPQNLTPPHDFPSWFLAGQGVVRVAQQPDGLALGGHSWGRYLPGFWAGQGGGQDKADRVGMDPVPTPDYELSLTS